MKSRVAVVLVVALVACSSPGHDVVGPFTGAVTRYVVDAIAVPTTSMDSVDDGDDLDGNGTIDNKLGAATGALVVTSDLSLDGADMIASGALASTLELQADDPSEDPTAGATLRGADGDDATVCGGALTAGAFTSNRTRDTRAPGAAIVRLPIFTNADPIALPIDGLELDLTPDGRGGLDGKVRGGIRLEAARAAAYTGLLQMIADEPARHIAFERTIDENHDGAISRDEADGSIIGLLVAADLQLFDGDHYAPVPSSQFRDSVSVGFSIHLSPCASGRCASVVPVNACRDRIRDGSETDVDCGGACQPCATAAHCSAPADCQSAACDAGACRAPSCTDGVRDGIESDVDCGGACPKCTIGQICAASSDCAAGTCNNSVGGAGHCVGP